MNLTCSQMDVLISFYIDGDLSNNLKKQVEEHIRTCPTCKAKFNIISSMVEDLKNNLKIEKNSFANKQNINSTPEQYRIFKTNLSAYIDNELSSEESLKIKKLTINNKKARKELEDSYNIRRLMNGSFNKVQEEAKKDFSKSILKQLQLEEEATLGFHPAIKLLVGFTTLVLIITSIILISFSV